MRIVYFQPSVDSRVGGPARTTLDTAITMAQAGHKVALVTQELGDATLPTITGSGSLAVHTLPPWGRMESLPRAAWPKLDAVLNGADALHVLGVFSYGNIQACRRARKLGVPYHVSIAGMLDDHCFEVRAGKKLLYMALVGKRWLRRAASVVCTAEEELNESSRFFPRERGVVIPAFVDLTPFHTLPGPGAALERWPRLGEVPAVISLGRVHPIKGLERLIEAVGLLRSQSRPCAVVIAGGGEAAYIDSLRALGERHGLGEDLIFTGGVGGDLKLSLLQAARVYCSPSLHENFGIAMVEGMLAGLPTVTTPRVKIWREIERSGGATITELTAPDLARGLAAYLGDPLAASAAGARARAWGMAFLEPGALVAAYERLYRRS
jgi:glycosyltransferase involved in cell wall biosynthesis